MTSVNAELYHREFDRKNEKYAEELEKQEAVREDEQCECGKPCKPGTDWCGACHG
jgi:hypothetical protein